MKRLMALLCTLLLITAAIVPAAAATPGAASKLIPTNIPKTFPAVKQDSTFTQVNFWHAMTAQIPVTVSNICNWYNATEGKKNKTYVKPIFQGDYDAITVKLQATLQSGNLKDLPDLVQLSSQGSFSIKDSKNLVLMQDLMVADSTFKIKDKLDKSAMYACSYKGKQLGMPFSNSVIVNFYNGTAFKAAGLDPNNPPKTLSEYADAAVKLTIKGKGSKPLRYGAVNKVYTFQFSTWIPRQKGGTAYQFDQEDGRQGVPTKLICAEDGTLKATLTEWGKALKTGAVNFNSNSRTNFEQGQACMFSGSIMGYEAVLTNLKAVKDPSKQFEVRMSRLPVVNENDAIGEAAGGSAVYMFNKGDEVKKQKTWQFVKFLASVDVSAYWYIQTGYFPLNNDAINTKYVQDSLTALPEKKIPLQIRTESAKYYKFQEPWIPGQAVYSNLLGDQCALLGTGKITVDQAVENIAKKANALLKTYWDANK